MTLSIWLRLAIRARTHPPCGAVRSFLVIIILGGGGAEKQADGCFRTRWAVWGPLGSSKSSPKGDDEGARRDDRGRDRNLRVVGARVLARRRDARPCGSRNALLVGTRW